MLSSIEDKLQEVEQAKEEDKESLLKSAEQKIKMFKGYVAEALLKENLKDCFEEISEKEVQQETSQGKTNIDITCREAKEDFKIENVEVKKGEDLFIESKIGDKAYITQQIDHMKKQVEGHHNEGNESKNGYKSIIVVSADYKNINDEKRAEFEKHLKEVGTELVVLDKMASEIDDKVRESIQEDKYMKRMYLLEKDLIADFNKKIKLYNRLIAKKYLKSVEKNDVLEQGILDCKAEIINLLENNNFDFLDDVDIKVIKNEYNDDDIVRQLLDKNYINSDQVKILIEELDKSKENSENLIRFLRISLKKDLSVVMFYIQLV